MFFILLIALSLALDAFAVSVTSSLTVKEFKMKNALVMGLYFGGFQFVMPLIGWFWGSTVENYVTRLGPYISFVLLAAIGGRMIWEALHEEGEEPVFDMLTHSRLLLLAVATSIDALAVGVSLAFLNIPILFASAVIGLVAFLLSIAGGFIGGMLGEKFQKRAQLVGGAVLVVIGIKIFVESFL